MDNSKRTKFFIRDNSLEKVLFELNTAFEGLFLDDINRLDDHPIIMIMGCPRSGSTILLQYLASLGIFSYPSNLIARFYKNPFVGIKIQQALYDYDPINQMGFEEVLAEKSKSYLGRTVGALMPSEYWYYWRQYFKFGEYNQLKKEELETVDMKSFYKNLNAYQYLTGKPLVLKGMILNWHIPFLYKTNKRIIFINIKRDHFYTAQSLLKARETFFNDKTKWFSFKPEEYKFLKENHYLDQVAGQTVFTERAVTNGIETLPDENVLNVNYSEFCEDPFYVVKQLKEKLIKLDYDLDLTSINNKEVTFTESKHISLDREDEITLRNAINKYLNFK